MILRNLAIRHGRKALGAPLRRSFWRALTTETLSQEPPSLDSSIQDQFRQAHAQLQHITNSSSSASEPEVDPFIEKYAVEQHTKKSTHALGSRPSKVYNPENLVANPPKPEDVTLELLMASQSHMGHNTSLWNPANSRYIYGIRQGIHIISLEETAAHLRRAAKVVEGVAYHGGLILFVGTRARQARTVVKAAQMAKGCHLFERWLPGGITNKDQLLRKCGIKVVDKDDNEIADGFQEKLLEWSSLKPDLVVCLNPVENYLLLHECGLHNIPTIGVIDTDADPTWVTYPIPANDDSMRCIQVIAGVLGRAGEEGQRRRLEAAKTGTITWLPPPGLGKPETAADKLKKENENKKSRRNLNGGEKDGDAAQRISRSRSEISETIDDLDL